jgi:hypothetical protein
MTAGCESPPIITARACLVLLRLLAQPLSVVQPFIVARTLDALNFWRSTLGLIEDDPDFWYPCKVEGDTDLDVTRARVRHWSGMPTRQAGSPLRLSRRAPATDRLVRFIVRHPDRFHPNKFFAIWAPALLALVWTLSLILSLQLMESSYHLFHNLFRLFR